MSPDGAKGPLGGRIVPGDNHGYRATEMDSYRHLPKEEGFHGFFFTSSWTVGA